MTKPCCYKGSVSEESHKDRNKSDPAGIAPIFTWRPETIDGLPTSTSQMIHPVPEQFRDMDKIIRAILEERHAEALLMLERNDVERSFVENIPESSRSDVLAQIEKVDSDFPSSQGGLTWSKKQKVIANALDVLDAFVPKEYQIVDEYWLIKRFWGALLIFANNSVCCFIPDAILYLLLTCTTVPR